MAVMVQVTLERNIGSPDDFYDMVRIFFRIGIRKEQAMQTIGTVNNIDLLRLKDYIMTRDSGHDDINISRLSQVFKLQEEQKIISSLKYLWDKSYNERYVKKLEEACNYCEVYKQQFDLCYKDETQAIIRYPDGKNYSLLPLWSLQFTLFVDYSETPLSLLRLSGSGMDVSNALALNESDTVNTKKTALEKKQDEITEAKNRIKEMEDEKNKELERLKQELEAKFAGRMKVLDDKKAELERMKKTLEGELFLLETEIYGIRCFLGETVKFARLVSGKDASITEPVVLYQKVRYLDEELAKSMAIYDVDGEDCKLFEELIKVREDIRDLFFPEGKSISLVRISADGTGYVSKQKRFAEQNGSVYVSNIMESYEVYHGTRLAILVRNGDNCYMGWTDVDKINITDGNAFYNAGTKSHEEDDGKSESSSKEEIASRYFIFSILQGMVLNSKIINLPEGEDIIHGNPKHVIYSMADNWITDTRFGDFKDIMERTTGLIRKDDEVLTMQSLAAEGYAYRKYSNERGRGYANRTHDVCVSDCTVYPINLVEERKSEIVRYESKYGWQKEEWHDTYTHGTLQTVKLSVSDTRNAREDILTEYKYFVSLEKDVAWYRDDDFKARANFQLYEDEFLNLTYLNSVYIRYIILNKKIGEWRVKGSKVNFSYLLPYLNKAMEHLVKREKVEAELISKFIDLRDVADWQVFLSDWKIKNDVHKITEYQAKRFAKHLLNPL